MRIPLLSVLIVFIIINITATYIYIQYQRQIYENDISQIRYSCVQTINDLKIKNRLLSTKINFFNMTIKSLNEQIDDLKDTINEYDNIKDRLYSIILEYRKSLKPTYIYPAPNKKSIENGFYYVKVTFDKKIQVIPSDRFKIICSGSMRPTFSCNNTLIITWDVDNINVGDIVGYYKDGKYIMHRIVNISHGYVITKGDNNFYNDDKINISDIKFKVIGVLY